MADPVKSADRVLQLLELLGNAPGGMTFAEICTELALPKSSAHALLSTMVNRSFLTQEPGSPRFTVGARLWEIAQASAGRSGELSALAQPYMTQVRDTLNEIVQLAVLDGIENVYIGKCDANQSLALVSRVGVRLPAHATGLGKAMLAGLSNDEVERRFDGAEFRRFTDRTITSLPGLLEQLEATRRRGRAVDDGEYTEGVFCIAMPVRDQTRKVIAAMSVSIPNVRYSVRRGEEITEALTTAAVDLSVRLGCPSEPSDHWYDVLTP